ncbi:hypothetical protein FJ872_17085 [Mesorhizobium sp. B2-5-9]|nr:hypothetical protein A9K65_030040 [Mesorhizobium sp. WSM1497]PBC14732.1 hypothetical protein CK225_18275 [Mesorhizobium loti]TPI76314.1 hypothetical protein FJ423_21855 [Mesorhizobium sp. B2-8-9]TPJ24382.1 hypothetical protein FJ425_21460 [Mesorhizobium sp. B2-7-2]TPJ37952.1 hypothetical protein FJ437_31275 [Mesorhizobium sp. B2-6-6]TPJ40476.1 hypothetical protein FJ432_15740 [Mesorhizobium sp. B2-6-5]TPJ64100.1 hypothetical protein FJ462_22510 [Mesorhizobium sp. B2-6-7]TPJ76425.1 hypothe
MQMILRAIGRAWHSALSKIDTARLRRQRRRLGDVATAEFQRPKLRTAEHSATKSATGPSSPRHAAVPMMDSLQGQSARPRRSKKH